MQQREAAGRFHDEVDVARGEHEHAHGRRLRARRKIATAMSNSDP
jgi:hypothetical protein